MFSRLNVIENFNNFTAALSNSPIDEREECLKNIANLVSQCLELRK